MSALIGALRVSLSAETAQFEAGMKRAQRTAANTNSAFKKSFGGLGNIVKAGFAGVVSGISIGLITQGVKAALDYAGSLGEVSQQLGVTTRDLQVFRYAAGQAGISQEEMEKGLARLTKSMGEAQVGSKSMIKAFGAIGISVDEIRGKDAGQVFRMIADGLAKIPNAAQRAAVETAIFGRAGQKLDTLLAGGSAAINQLARAAEELGIVLSDEQIQKADETADKLEAVKTVLSARLAGVVADNADAILQLADAFAAVAAEAAKAAAGVASFASQGYGIELPTFTGRKNFTIGGPDGLIAPGKPGAKNALARIMATGLKPSEWGGPKSTGGGGSVSNFLAGGGGGGRSKRDKADDAERKRQEALRAAYQFDQELLRAQQDVLRAQQQLSTDYSERAALSIQMLNLEQQGFQREMEYAVASGDLTKTQAAQLEAEYAKRDALERQAVLAEEEANRKEDYNGLDQLDFDLKRDILESEGQLADTTSERLDVELRLLDLFYRQERARLDAVLADETSSWAAKEEARRRLAALNKTEQNDRQAARDRNRSPLQDYKARYSDISEENEEAIVGGLEGMADALSRVTEGWDAMKKAALDTLQSLVQALIRNQINQLFAMLIPSPAGFQAGGVAGFATGGWVSGKGTATSDSIPAMLSNGEFVVNAKSAKQFMPLLERINDGSISTLAMGGLPIARVSHGERVNISNDNGGRGGGNPVSISFAINGPVTRETQMQIAAAARRGIASANRKGM